MKLEDNFSNFTYEVATFKPDWDWLNNKIEID